MISSINVEKISLFSVINIYDDGLFIVIVIIVIVIVDYLIDFSNSSHYIHVVFQLIID